MEDLRVRRTKKLIQEATMQLIDEKGFSNVKIVDIANRANINRNTIYLHYETKEDIVISMVDEAFANSWKGIKIDSFIPNKPTKKNLYNLFYKLLSTIGDNVELYRIILTDPSLSGYLDKRILKIRNVVAEKIKDSKRNNIGIEYLSSGIIGVLKKWIIYGTGTIEDNAKIVSELTYMNFRHLLMTR